MHPVFTVLLAFYSQILRSDWPSSGHIVDMFINTGWVYINNHNDNH